MGNHSLGYFAGAFKGGIPVDTAAAEAEKKKIKNAKRKKVEHNPLLDSKTGDDYSGIPGPFAATWLEEHFPFDHPKFLLRETFNNMGFTEAWVWRLRTGQALFADLHKMDVLLTMYGTTLHAEGLPVVAKSKSGARLMAMDAFMIADPYTVFEHEIGKRVEQEVMDEFGDDLTPAALNTLTRNQMDIYIHEFRETGTTVVTEAALKARAAEIWAESERISETANAQARARQDAWFAASPDSKTVKEAIRKRKKAEAKLAKQ